MMHCGGCNNTCSNDLMCSDHVSLLNGIAKGTTVLPGFWLNGASTTCGACYLSDMS
jgi:hypothetical protein